MTMQHDTIIDAYSRHAAAYDDAANAMSCWGRASRELWDRLAPRRSDRLVVDVGCGSGDTLAYLAGTVAPETDLIGVEPAPGLEVRARERCAMYPHIEVRRGRFEELPLDSGSVDYLYSLMAFHWVADAEAAVAELARVLRQDAGLDLFFIGRMNGREFVKATTPIFLRYMGPTGLLASARLRLQLTREAAQTLFEQAFPMRRVEVGETFTTYYDSWERHQAWWVRIEAQMLAIPDETRDACMRDVERVLQALATPAGIPYTLHLLHVHLVSRNSSSGTLAANGA